LGGTVLVPVQLTAAPTASLRAVQAVQRDGAATLELRLSAPVNARSFALSNPNRFVIDLPATRLALRESVPKASAPIRALRLATRNGNSVRMVVQLEAGATASLRNVSGAAGIEGLLRITLHEANPARQERAANANAAAAPAVAIAAAHAPSSTARDIVIAIDAGHGGDDPGASGRSGTQEKRITLAIARELAERINAAPGMRAILTRSSDTFVPLRDRTARARSARADLFVSIHADAVRDREVEGASVYTLSDRGASSEAARFLADRENAADLKGVSLAGKSNSLASVLVDLSQSAAMGSSTEAAAVVLQALDRVGAVRKSIVQHAGFVVLKSPDMPSMLIETAYISNPAEEQKLRSSAYQRQLAGAIAAGVANYFRDHPPDGTRFAAERHADKNLVLARTNQ
jgi:N-acetylmuramoyl-L-alanine amidase